MDGLGIIPLGRRHEREDIGSNRSVHSNQSGRME